MRAYDIFANARITCVSQLAPCVSGNWRRSQILCPRRVRLAEHVGAMEPVEYAEMAVVAVEVLVVLVVAVGAGHELVAGMRAECGDEPDPRVRDEGEEVRPEEEGTHEAGAHVGDRVLERVRVPDRCRGHRSPREPRSTVLSPRYSLAEVY